MEHDLHPTAEIRESRPDDIVMRIPSVNYIDTEAGTWSVELGIPRSEVLPLVGALKTVAYTSEQGEAEKILKIVSDTVIEANDVGGVDINDLVHRLKEAGYQLPEEG